MMTADEFRRDAAALKGGESLVYFTGHLGEKAETNRDVWELGRVAWDYAHYPINLGLLTQRRNMDGFDYIFTRRRPKKGPRR